MSASDRDRPVVSRLAGIEALRGLAAAAVVLFHAARHVDKVRGAPGLILVFQAGHAGVDLFFVISGFIILFVHGRDIGRPERLAHYLGRRFTRVLPLYWLALAVTIILEMAGRHGVQGPFAIVWSALLLPSFGVPILGIAWTLQFETLFYALFAVLIIGRSAGSVLFALWLVAIAAAAAGLRPSWLAPSLCGAYGVEFFFGMAVAYAARRWTMPAPKLLAGGGAVAFLTAMMLESGRVLDGFGLAGRIVYGLAALLLVLGVAASGQAGALPVPAWLRRLGGASYSIYLFQFVFIGLVWQALLTSKLERQLGNAGLFALLASAALVGGVMTAAVVERPLLGMMRGRRALRPAFPSLP